MQFAGLALLALAAQILAVPIPLHGRGNSASSMTATEIASYSFYANFVAAAYCSGTVDWSCKACKLIPGFIPYATGGNGGTIPLWYVGWWPAGSTVVVAHEGTDPLQFRSLLTDANIILESLSTTLFPNATSSVKVHSGFRDAHAASATSVLSTVKKIIAERKATKVTLVGHSLGGAIAALDSLYLSLNLPSIIIKGITYGQPRVGNQAFADWMDQTVTDFSRITNRKDLVPILPGRFLGFRHSGGEKHIRSEGVWSSCQGQENDTSAKCTVGAVPTIVHGNLIDHLGPYERIWLGCDFKLSMISVATGDNPKLPGVGDSVDPLFVIGNSEQKGLTKSSRISAKTHIPAHLSSSLAPKMTRANDSTSKRAKPKVYGTIRPNRKLDNTPVPQAVPLAFPASTNFNFRAPELDEKPLLSTTNRKPPVRAIQILPTEVLVLVIQWIDPSRLHPILKTMSLVNQTLNASIAPLLYHRLRLFNLREVYDFSLYFRHPLCVTSLDMFITPDPNDIGWLPQNTTWAERFGNMLAAMTRLMSLRINRCDVSSALSAITTRAGDPSFLPTLQKLSFGQWHELSCLAPGRYIISYGFTFTLHAPQDYAKLERVLVALKRHGHTIRDLSLTVIIAHKPDFVTRQTMDYRKSILHIVINHMPELHTMVLRTQCQTDARLYTLPHKAADILALVPQRMPNLRSLEIYDPRSPQYRSVDIIKGATELSQEQGLCPMLHSISLDGLLWKRAPSQLSSLAGVSLYLSTLTVEELPGASVLVRSLEQRKPHVFAPKVTWSPCPSNSRGRMWWARRVSELHATSKAQAVFLLRQWMLQYWDHQHVMNDDNQLERAITRI